MPTYSQEFNETVPNAILTKKLTLMSEHPLTLSDRTNSNPIVIHDRTNANPAIIHSRKQYPIFHMRIPDIKFLFKCCKISTVFHEIVPNAVLSAPTTTVTP